MVTTKLTMSRSILHYDPDRIDYAVTESELRQLEEEGNSTWKDICLGSATAFLGFAPNALGELVSQSTFRLTMALFFNSVLAVACFIFAVCFGVAWKRATKNRRAILEHIRNKPRVILKAESLEVEGAVEPEPVGVARKIKDVQ